MRLNLPNIGFLPQGSAEQRQEDLQHVRALEGNGGSFLVAPGLLELSGVSTRGLVLEEKIERSVPLNPQFTQMLDFVTDCCQLIHAGDGTPLVERNRWSNDGIWQPGELFYVRGTWDPEINPPPEVPLRPLERVHRPVLTGPNVMEQGGGEVSVSRGRAAKGAP